MYTVAVTEPTCEAGGYTTHTCSCGHEYTDKHTPAVKHDYQPKYTETEHWTECIYCHKTTEKASHKPGAWQTVLKPGYTFDGIKERSCKICGYSVTESIPALTLPEDKFVISIPDYTVSGTPSSGGSTDGKPSSGSDTPTGTNPDSGSESADKTKPTVSAPTEILSKGSGNTVPTLPTLSSKEEGNIFGGWVNKATGEPVKKGDKLTENIEIVPVWKDCDEGNHIDADGDGHCDVCGYITVKAEVPEDTTAPADETTADTTAENEKTPQEKDDFPWWMVIVISCFGGVIVICGIVLAVLLKKKK